METAAPALGHPRPARGRRSEAEQIALRERIETLLLQGLSVAAIHRALTGPEAPVPISLSVRRVREHVRAITRSWQARAARDRLDKDRATALARLDDAMRTARMRSTLNASSNVGVGYFNAYLKAQEQWSRLRGLDAPTRTELTGPDGGPLVIGELAPLEHAPTTPEEELRRLGLRQAELELAIRLREEAGACSDTP